MEILERAGEGVVKTKSADTYIAAGQSSHLTFSVQELAEEHEGGWTVRDIETGIFGTGSDMDAAVEDFSLALREHLDVLERQSALSEELEAQIRYLRRRLG